MNDLVIVDHEIVVQEGKFELIGYDKLLKQIDELGDFLASIEVTNENIKESKRLVAQVRKMTDNLNRERIEFKKQYLRPVEHLESQVKTLTETVGKYEGFVRHQIRQLEEQERDQKKMEIKELFDLRAKKYGTPELYPFDSFIEPRHLNKSTSMNKVETEMVDWFENRQKEITTLMDFAKTNKFEQTEVLNHYLTFDDLLSTLNYYNNLIKEKQILQESLEELPNKVKRDTPVYIPFFVNRDNLEEARKLLKINGIDFYIKP